MSSKGKKHSNTSASRVRRAAENKRARRNVAKHSRFLLWFTAIALVGIFVGRWYSAIGKGYYESFVEINASTPSAVANMHGLTPTEEEREELLPLEQQWDLFASSRLRDEVTTTADDGVELHAYLYDEGSDVTVVVLPRFYVDGTAAFLPGPYLNELTGCNLLLIDPRAQGGSGGAYFTYGMKEQYDLAAWLRWADETLGPQTFLVWGEGTGANTALFAAANGLMPDSVAFIAAEAPYASLRQMARTDLWKWYRVPAVFLTAIEGRLNRSGAGFRLDDIELAAALDGASPTVPVLFLLSEKDAYIQPAWSEAVAESYAGPQGVIEGGGSHGTVYADKTAVVQAALAAWWAGYGA